ncbi:protein enabled homolog [Macrobrachium rosenbergii]|uniref:protein enabled homolog n=1 Tax=Macrobrachium rosenbergii TaxID=79674 RepID=UPI0034D78A76
MRAHYRCGTDGEAEDDSLDSDRVPYDDSVNIGTECVRLLRRESVKKKKNRKAARSRTEQERRKKKTEPRERRERAAKGVEQRREKEEREERRRQQEAEQRREEEEREERRRQYELALKDRELELERAKKESAEALAAQQASSPTPSALNAFLSTVNNLNGPPNKPPCPICKKYGHNETDCRYKDSNQQGNNPRQPTNNHLDTAFVTVTAVQPSAKPSIRIRGTAPNPPRPHSRPSPQISRPDGHQRITPSSQGDLAHYRCRTCNVRGHSERWSKCPSRLGAAANSTEPRGPALSSRQESLSHTMPGTPRVLDPLGPPSALSDTNSLPVPLASTSQCQAPPILAGCSLLSVLSVPGPELVPVPDPEHDSDPPTGDPPNLTTIIIAQCEPPTPDVSSSHSLLPAVDDPLAGLGIASFLVDQELSSQDAEADALPTMVVAAAEVGDQPVAPEAALDPAPDGTPGRSLESAPSLPPRNGLARPWRPPKKKKGRKKSS